LFLAVFLKDLNFNFYTVIVPEALTAFEAEESSVLSIASDVDDLVTSLGAPLDVILVQLEMLMANVVASGSSLSVSV
jgi:hypothetical protein